MEGFFALILKIWPLLAAGATGFAVVLKVLWNISAGVTTTVNTLTTHTQKHADHEIRIERLADELHRVDTRVGVVESQLKGG
jgi:hypothetical protein